VSGTLHHIGTLLSRVQLNLDIQVIGLSAEDRCFYRSIVLVERCGSRNASACRWRRERQMDNDARVVQIVVVGYHSTIDTDDGILAHIMPRDVRAVADVK
jgi:hypothetical protein